VSESVTTYLGESATVGEISAEPKPALISRLTVLKTSGRRANHKMELTHQVGPTRVVGRENWTKPGNVRTVEGRVAVTEDAARRHV